MRDLERRWLGYAWSVVSPPPGHVLTCDALGGTSFPEGRGRGRQRCSYLPPGLPVPAAADHPGRGRSDQRAVRGGLTWLPGGPQRTGWAAVVCRDLPHI